MNLKELLHTNSHTHIHMNKNKWRERIKRTHTHELLAIKKMATRVNVYVMQSTKNYACTRTCGHLWQQCQLCGQTVINLKYQFNCILSLSLILSFTLSLSVTILHTLYVFYDFIKTSKLKARNLCYVYVFV